MESILLLSSVMSDLLSRKFVSKANRNMSEFPHLVITCILMYSHWVDITSSSFFIMGKIVSKQQ
jgi:hypothetical protein